MIKYFTRYFLAALILISACMAGPARADVLEFSAGRAGPGPERNFFKPGRAGRADQDYGSARTT